MMIAGVAHAKGAEHLRVVQDARWFRRPLMAAPATKLVLHETAGAGDPIATLRVRKLSVQFVCEPSGRLRQHADAVAFCQHIGAHNGTSIGVEVMNPYYPNLRPKAGPWQEVIEAPWAHRGRYVLPTPAQAETIAQLVQWATSTPHQQIRIAQVHHGLHRGKFWLTRLPPGERPAGVYSHHHLGGHADGAWLALYAWLRLEAGLDPAAAYEQAKVCATGARGRVDVSDLLPATAQPAREGAAC